MNHFRVRRVSRNPGALIISSARCPQNLWLQKVCHNASTVLPGRVVVCAKPQNTFRLTVRSISGCAPAGSYRGRETVVRETFMGKISSFRDVAERCG